MKLHSKNNANQEIGQKGEEQAVAFLANKGFKILDLNWRYRKYEIDIVAEQNNTLVIIEVKTRSSEQFGNPESFVNVQKQRFLIAAANAYVDQKQILNEIRFDIISIIHQNNEFKIEHIPDAFYPRV